MTGTTAKRRRGRAEWQRLMQDYEASGQTQMKVLYFDRSGYCVWAKRLERGRFHYREQASGKVRLDWTALKLLLEGIEVDPILRHVRYRHREEASALV